MKKKPFAIYFATKEELNVVGETTDTIKQYALANNNSFPTTVFELPKVIDHLRSFGVVEFAKAAVNKENRELLGKYEADKYMIVVVAPDGKRIGGWSIVGGNLNAAVAQAKVTIEAWQNQFGPKTSAKP